MLLGLLQAVGGEVEELAVAVPHRGLGGLCLLLGSRHRACGAGLLVEAVEEAHAVLLLLRSGVEGSVLCWLLAADVHAVEESSRALGRSWLAAADEPEGVLLRLSGLITHEGERVLLLLLRLIGVDIHASEQVGLLLRRLLLIHETKARVLLLLHLLLIGRRASQKVQEIVSL